MSTAQRNQVVFRTDPDGKVGVTVKREDGMNHLPGLLFTAKALEQQGVDEEDRIAALRACELAYMANNEERRDLAWLRRGPFPFIEV